MKHLIITFKKSAKRRKKNAKMTVAQYLLDKINGTSMKKTAPLKELNAVNVEKRLLLLIWKTT